uniref:Uncharacterized protein n=1 Tax=Plectus sambesii TaxID=2011161 RepID=A0A914XIE6_9BILA
SRLEQNLVLDDVCDILCEHFEANFEPYIKYCSNQVYQDRTLRKLKTENSQFMSTLQRLEGDRQCQGLDMRSFLMLPMQRVTRYPLLVIAILDRVQTATERHKTSTRALHLANTVVGNCNEGARRMERTEQLLDIDRRLIYKNGDLRRIPLVSSGRYLIKHGQLTQICDRGGLRKSSLLASVHSKRRSRPIYLFLFSDLLMVTKKKVNGTYVAKDYCMRAFVEIEPMEPTSPKVSPTLLTALPLKPHLFTCTLMNNAKGKQSEMLLSAESESDRERWLSAMRPPTSANPEESVYPDWDCPQATTVHRYASAQDDELHLEIGEIVNVLRKMPDGWYFGERCRDGKAGWFPSSYVQEILNDHVRAKNYRQRLRMIQWSKNHHSPVSRTRVQFPLRAAPHPTKVLIPPWVGELVAAMLRWFPLSHHPGDRHATADRMFYSRYPNGGFLTHQQPADTAKSGTKA